MSSPKKRDKKVPSTPPKRQRTSSDGTPLSPFKRSLQPISPGISPIKKPKSLKNKKSDLLKTAHHDEFIKVKTKIDAINTKFIAESQELLKKRTEKTRHTIKISFFPEKANKNVTKFEFPSLNSKIDFKLFENILKNWGFEDKEIYSTDYSETNISVKDISIIVNLVETSVSNYDLEKTKKTFRYLYCLILDPSVESIHVSSAMKATYDRLKNLNASNEDIISILVRGKIPSEVAINMLGAFYDYDDDFVFLYAVRVSPLDESLDFLKYLNDCRPEFYEINLVYFIYQRVETEYPIDVLKETYKKLKEMQDELPLVLFSTWFKFSEHCWRKLKPHLSLSEKIDLH